MAAGGLHAWRLPKAGLIRSEGGGSCRVTREGLAAAQAQVDNRQAGMCAWAPRDASRVRLSSCFLLRASHFGLAGRAVIGMKGGWTIDA
jgi:hypothetical protein